MADTDIKPEVTIAKIDSETLANISRNREVVRKTDVRAVEEKVKCISKNVRRMTVSYVSIRHYDCKTERTRRYTRRGSLRLNGQWMEEAGFTTGTPLDVRVMPGCLVITTRPEETSFIKNINNIIQMSKRGQEQVRRFLTGVAAKVVLESV